MVRLKKVKTLHLGIVSNSLILKANSVYLHFSRKPLPNKNPEDFTLRNIRYV